MATQTFGELLYYPQTEGLTEFPSPESLKNKIIISTKAPKEYLKSKSGKDRGNTNSSVLEGSESSEEESWGQESSDSMAELETVDRVRQRWAFFNLYICNNVYKLCVLCCFSVYG